MIDHLALYRATHQDSHVTSIQIDLSFPTVKAMRQTVSNSQSQVKVWFVRIVRKLAWKVIRMTAPQRPTCIAEGAPRRHRKGSKANVALTISE